MIKEDSVKMVLTQGYRERDGWALVVMKKRFGQMAQNQARDANTWCEFLMRKGLNQVAMDGDILNQAYKGTIRIAVR